MTTTKKKTKNIIDKYTKAELKALKMEATKELCRRDFFSYCQLKAPDFYLRSRKYLVTLCDELQTFLTSEKKVLIINMPPRHGKSRTLQLFVEWLLGNDQTKKIMTGSYNETLSTMFSKGVRNSIQEEKADDSKLIFSDVFPGVRIKKGDASMNLWSLENGYNNYLATSPTGTATGFGADFLLLDDTIKNAKESYNELVKKNIWDWFTNTMLSRLEEGGKIIIVMTRWSSDDLAGRALNHYRKEQIKHINMKAVQDDGTMLCDDILSHESNEEKKKAMGLDIWSANYQQETLSIKKKLYTHLSTYKSIPRDSSGNALFEGIYAYTDTADTGADFLCSVVYGKYNKEAYVLDVLYTSEAMEYTEPQTAELFFKNNVNTADIESNNGGRGFARNVERILKEKYKSNKTVIHTFHQSKNKQARILSSSSWVMEHVLFPEDWESRFPDFAVAIHSYQKEGKNEHDDAPDVLAGIYDKMTVPINIYSFE